MAVNAIDMEMIHIQSKNGFYFGLFPFTSRSLFEACLEYSDGSIDM